MRELISAYLSKRVRYGRNILDDERPPISCGEFFINHIADYLTDNLPPSFDKVFGLLCEWNKKHDSDLSHRLVCFGNGGGAVETMNFGLVFNWQSSDTPGVAAINAISAKLQPEMTPLEHFERLLGDVGYLRQEDLEAVRKALGGKQQ